VRTCRGYDWQVHLPRELKKFFFFNVGQGTNNRKLPFKHILKRLHGAYLPLEEEIEEHGLDNIIHVMGKGNLCASQIMSSIKEGLPFVPTAPKTAK